MQLQAREMNGIMEQIAFTGVDKPRLGAIIELLYAVTHVGLGKELVYM